MATRPDAIVAYTYNADIYCSLECVRDEMVANHKLHPSSRGVPADVVLSLLADTLGIDPMDERTYDSGCYPKVVFNDQVEEVEHCGRCHRLIY